MWTWRKYHIEKRVIASLGLFFLIFNSFPDEEVSVGAHLKGELFSVIKEHEDGHLEGGDLQYVLPSDLSTPRTGFWIIFLQMRQSRSGVGNFFS